MNKASEVLGVLDWGIGGLGVVASLRAHNIETPILYVSDTAAIPYGRLPAPQLTERVDQVIAWMVERGATRVLTACNAASTVIGKLAPHVPVSGVIEPALRSLIHIPASTIGVIGGARTIASGLYRRGLSQPDRTVIQRVAQPLSAHIEAGTIESDIGQRDIERILKPLQTVDILVLACTHYPAIAAQLQHIVPNARLFDPATSVATELGVALTHRNGNRDVQLMTTGDAQAMRNAATRAWGCDPGTCERVTI